jgi:hypothetical protein
MVGVRIGDGGVRGIAAALVLACCVLPNVATAGASGRSGDTLDRLREAGGIGPAQYALVRARSLFDLDQVRSRYGRVRAPAPRAATPILERLASALPLLPPGARRQASAILARPTEGASDQLGDGYRHGARGVRHRCFRVRARGKRHSLCLHWVRRTHDRSSPAQVRATIRTLRHVWKVEVSKMGYRPPLGDLGPRRGQGPNRGLDVYLSDVGDDGFYGYCIGDPPRKKPTVRREHKRAHAYCVLDNDFSARQYPSSASGKPALKVAAAHELFHAIQSAYEASKKERWFRESTATWIEDEVYDPINANYGVLEDSPLAQPEIPLDSSPFNYGSWVFWRFLSEYYGSPAPVKRVWQLAAPRRGVNRTALEALRSVTAHRRPEMHHCLFCTTVGFNNVFAEFSTWLENYPITFEEGPAYFSVLKHALPVSDADHVLLSRPSSTGERELAVDHLSSRLATVSVSPTVPADAPVRVSVDLPSRSSSAAIAEAFHNDTQVTAELIALDQQGRGTAEFMDISTLFLILPSSSAARDNQPFHYRVEVLP